MPVMGILSRQLRIPPFCNFRPVSGRIGFEPMTKIETIRPDETSAPVSFAWLTLLDGRHDRERDRPSLAIGGRISRPSSRSVPSLHCIVGGGRTHEQCRRHGPGEPCLWDQVKGAMATLASSSSDDPSPQDAEKIAGAFALLRKLDLGFFPGGSELAVQVIRHLDDLALHKPYPIAIEAIRLMIEVGLGHKARPVAEAAMKALAIQPQQGLTTRAAEEIVPMLLRQITPESPKKRVLDSLSTLAGIAKAWKAWQAGISPDDVRKIGEEGFRHEDHEIVRCAVRTLWEIGNHLSQDVSVATLRVIRTKGLAHPVREVRWESAHGITLIIRSCPVAAEPDDLMALLDSGLNDPDLGIAKMVGDAMETIAFHRTELFDKSRVAVLERALSSVITRPHRLPPPGFISTLGHLVNRSDSPKVVSEAHRILIEWGLPNGRGAIAQRCSRILLERATIAPETFSADQVSAIATNSIKGDDADAWHNVIRLLQMLAEKNPASLNPSVVDLLRTRGLTHEDHETAALATEALGVILRLEKYRALLPDVWRELGLRSIEFGDGGNSFSTIPPFIKGYLQETSAPRRARLRRLAAPCRTTIGDLLESQGVAGAEPRLLGRSWVYPLAFPDKLLVLKYLKREPKIQDPDDLAREIHWLETLKDLPLKSRLPRSLPEITDPPKIFCFENDTKAIAFETSADYYRYLDDPSLTDAEFRTGLGNAVHDLFLLARHGIFHTAPSAAFHNAEPGAIYRATGDRGRYVIAPDLVFGFETRSGMGRLDNWPEALRYGNMGVTGLRDFEELATLDEIRDNGERWCPELRRLEDRPNADALYEGILLGNGLLAAALYIGNRMANDSKRYQDDAWFKRYADLLLEVFATGYAARRGIGEEDAKGAIESRADWLRLARQLAFFMTDAYVPFVREDADPSLFPPEIYGPATGISGQRGRPKFGPYRQRTFHPERGFVGPDGNPDSLSLGPVNGPFPVRELEKAIWGMMW